jgi:hypothetical protein
MAVGEGDFWYVKNYFSNTVVTYRQLSVKMYLQNYFHCTVKEVYFRFFAILYVRNVVRLCGVK